MSKGKSFSPSCPSSPTSPSPPPVSLSYSNWPRKRVSLSAPKKNPITIPIPHLQRQYSPISVNHLSNDVSDNKSLPENTHNKSPVSSTTPIQHHVIKGRISPILVARKGFSAHQDLASQQLMGRKITHPFAPSSCPSNSSSSSIPIAASSSAPPSTAISTRTARPSFARRTSAPSLLVSALVASHANSREKLFQDAGGQKNITEKEKSSYRSSKIPVASVPSISVTAIVEKAPEAPKTSSNDDNLDRRRPLTEVRKSCGALVRPALKHSLSEPNSASFRPKTVQFEPKFERIRHFLEAETPHSVTLLPTSLGPEPKKDVGSIVLPNFPPLTTCYHSKPVSVESVSLSPDGTRIQGLVQVQNLAYEKTVRARYTFDCWNTAQEAIAQYKEPIIRSDSHHRGLDRFEFTVPIPHRPDSADETADFWRTMYLAVQYQVAGNQYWDSNSGQNYQINIRQHLCFDKDEHEEDDQGIFELSDLGIADDESKENSPELSASLRKVPNNGKSTKPLSSPCSSASDFGYFSQKPSPLSAIPSSGTIPLRTTKKNLGNRYDFGASLAATVRPRSSSPCLSNSMYHRPSSPLSFSSFSSHSHASSSLSSTSLPIPTSSATTSTPSSSPYSTPFSAIALSVTTSSSPRSPTTIGPFPFMSSSSSVEAPISSTPWEERARTAAVAYCRPSSPSCDFSSNYSSSCDSSSFPGIPSAWTSYSPSLTANSPFDGIYPGSYSPLSSPYSSSPPATAIWG